jgi:DHA1 family bicyclomycin/chloramphenicol resistance-like MFS transporter
MIDQLEKTNSATTEKLYRMKMKPGEFIALSASAMTLTALGIDIMLPAFAELRIYFGLEEKSTIPAQIIVFFFLGQTAQIIFGALSDRFGRLAILRIGFPLYIIGGIAAAFAPTLALMFAARFVAGVGASAVFMTTIAGVRDRFVGDHMARVMSLIFTIFLFTPVVAPFLGIAILSFASWKIVFLTPPLFAILVFIWSLRLEESLPPERRSVFRLRDIASSIRTVLGNRVFLRYATITTFLFSALSSYVASSEHMIGEIYGRPELFAWIFAGIGLGTACCTLINSRLSLHFGARRAIRGLLIFYACIASMLLVYTVLSRDLPDISGFFIGVGLLIGLNLAIEPNSSALAMEPMGDRAGIASAVYGTYFFFIGSSLGSIVSQLMQTSVTPIVVSFFAFGVVSVILALSDRRPITK